MSLVSIRNLLIYHIIIGILATQTPVPAIIDGYIFILNFLLKKIREISNLFTFKEFLTRVRFKILEIK